MRKLILGNLYISLKIASRELKANEDLEETFMIYAPLRLLKIWLNATIESSLGANITPDLESIV